MERTGNFTHESALEDSNEGDDLYDSGSGDVVGAEDGGNTVGEVRELVARRVNVSGKVDSGTGDDLSEESKLTDTPVLDFNVTEAIKALLGGISTQKTEGIEESKRGLSTEFFLEGFQGSGGSSLLRGRGKGGSAGEEGGKNGELHGVLLGDF